VQPDLTRLEPIPPQPSLSRCGVENSAADVPALLGVVDQLSVGGPAMDGRDHGRSPLSMSETTTPWESRSQSRRTAASETLRRYPCPSHDQHVRVLPFHATSQS